MDLAYKPRSQHPQQIHDEQQELNEDPDTFRFITPSLPSVTLLRRVLVRQQLLKRRLPPQPIE